MSRKKRSRERPAATTPAQAPETSAEPSDGAALPGTLYSVAVPIGNVRDLSPRAADILCSVDIVAAEDTRVFRDLVRQAALTIRAHQVVSYHSYNEAERAPWLIGRLQAGDSVALVTDAGTPGINDPGRVVVRAAIDAGVPIVSVPGACAAIAALSISGLRTDRFHYVGFLPRRGGRRTRVLDEIADLPGTLVLYEAPSRLIETLSAVADVLGDREAVVTRNLTKPGERVLRGRLRTLQRELDTGEPTRGEYTILIEGAENAPAVLTPRVEAIIDEYIGRGADPSLVRQLAQELLHIRRDSLYDRVRDARQSL